MKISPLHQNREGILNTRASNAQNRHIWSNALTELIIATFNIFSLTSLTKRKVLADDLASHKVALCCLRETK